MENVVEHEVVVERDKLFQSRIFSSRQVERIRDHIAFFYLDLWESKSM